MERLSNVCTFHRVSTVTTLITKRSGMYIVHMSATLSNTVESSTWNGKKNDFSDVSGSYPFKGKRVIWEAHMLSHIYCHGPFCLQGLWTCRRLTRDCALKTTIDLSFDRIWAKIYQLLTSGTLRLEHKVHFIRFSGAREGGPLWRANLGH